MGDIVITGEHHPFCGVEGNTHNVYKFHATDTVSHFGFLYCVDKWDYADAEKDFTKRAMMVFGKAA